MVVTVAPSGGNGIASYSYSNVSAGIITLTGGLTPVTLMPGPSSAATSGIVYAPVSASGLPAGGVVTITATGDTAPPFTLDLPLPSVVTWLQPSPLSAWTIDTTQDLPITWSGGSQGTVLIGIQETQVDHLYSVQCTFAASAGGGTIPSSLLAYLPPSTADADGSTATANVSGFVQTSASIFSGNGWSIYADGQSSLFNTSATIE